MSPEQRERMLKGIACYRTEQAILLRLLRRRPFTQHDFDRWFRGREYRGRARFRGNGLNGDSFILGIGINGSNEWAMFS